MPQTRKSKNKSHFARYRQIAMVLMKYRLGEIMKVLGLEKFLPLRLAPPSLPWRKEACTGSQRTRMALEELGTTFVKVGQILSTRTDILPSDFAVELSKLQDSLKPLPVDVIEKVISEELGRPVAQVFRSFDPNPLGVASIGQAHAATLQDGTEVVVKARKPGVVEQVTEDLDILRHLAATRAQNWEQLQQYSVTRVVEEVADAIMSEMDYVREGRNAEHFAQFFKADPKVHIPKIFWEYTTSRVITMERIRGFGILNSQWLDKTGFDREELARRCVDIWLRMVFEDVAFHADPHPGNVFVEADGRLAVIDFGMVGMVDDEVRDNLATAVKAIITQDADLLIDSLTDMGAVKSIGYNESLRTDAKRALGSLQMMGPSRKAPPLDEIFAMLRRNHMQLPANLFLLLKAVSMAQGLGKGLDPDYDFFAQLRPHVERTVKNKYAPAAMAQQFPAAAADLALLGLGLPKRLSRIVRSIERGEIQVRTSVTGMEAQIQHMDRLVNRVVIGIVASAVIMGGAIVFLTYRLG